MSEEQHWMVIATLKFPTGVVAKELSRWRTLQEVDEAVQMWKDVLQEKCTCGECPTIERIEVVAIRHEVKTVYEREPSSKPSSAWKDIFK